MVAFFFQATGQVFSGHYGAVFVASLNTVNPFNITVSQSALNTFTSFIGIVLLDRVGRRPIWLTGSIGLMVSLMIMGGLGVRQPISYSVSQGIVAMMLVSLPCLCDVGVSGAKDERAQDLPNDLRVDDRTSVLHLAGRDAQPAAARQDGACWRDGQHRYHVSREEFEKLSDLSG